MAGGDGATQGAVRGGELLSAAVEVSAGGVADAAAAPSRGLTLRLITCGSVDDGKSTLIGRLLYDSKSILQDQWEAVHRSSLKRGDARVDLALLTDGLRAEREQGITIDVAYRYFSTPRRSFILADTPGHVQYTRNMATGASTADVALLLVDARQGVLEQTRRHAYIAALLGVSYLVLCVNKMDLVGWDRAVFDSIAADLRSFTGHSELGVSRSDVFDGTALHAIPVSALNGDNLVHPSEHTPWYPGPALLEFMETVQPRGKHAFEHARMPVQWIVRPQDDAHHDYRAVCGQIASGTLRVGDDVMILPSGARSRITRLHIGETDLQEASAPFSVSVVLADDIDASRGDTLVHIADGPNDRSQPRTLREFDADIVWMSEQALVSGKPYLIKHAAKYLKARFDRVEGVLNVHTLALEPRETPPPGLNDIARVHVRLAGPLVCDSYADCRATGAFIVIDEASNNTVAAGMIR